MQAILECCWLKVFLSRRNFAGGADNWNASDCDGHGTHVASTAAGRSVGVAKEASVVALRVLDCGGSGRISDVVAGGTANILQISEMSKLSFLDGMQRMGLR